jgi:hypothetical protein
VVGGNEYVSYCYVKTNCTVINKMYSVGCSPSKKIIYTLTLHCVPLVEAKYCPAAQGAHTDA